MVTLTSQRSARSESATRGDNLLVSREAIRTIRRVSRVVIALLAGLFPLWMAGCATAPERPSMMARPITTESVSDPLTVVLPAPLPDEPATNSAANAATPAAPPSGPAWPADWDNVWLPLETWARYNSLGKPVQFGGGNEAVFVLETTNGQMRVRINSHTLRFGGHDFWIGFTPRLMQGFPYIHALDARKTLQPLLGSAWQLGKPDRTVVVDAGHGGKDSGALSCFNGEYEKAYALDWARRVAILLRECGWNVVMTRTNDAYLTLADRVAIAERAKADVFVSLHFNSGAGNGSQSGVETYCQTPTGMPSSLLRGEDDPREAHPNNQHDDQNFQLATALHRSVVKTSGAADRGVGRARFLGVLRTQNRPAVLVEGGYLTNPDEARKIATPEYRQALAEGVAKALE